jgi:hypothetical protein
MKTPDPKKIANAPLSTKCTCGSMSKRHMSSMNSAGSPSRHDAGRSAAARWAKPLHSALCLGPHRRSIDRAPVPKAEVFRLNHIPKIKPPRSAPPTRRTVPVKPEPGPAIGAPVAAPTTAPMPQTLNCGLLAIACLCDNRGQQSPNAWVFGASCSPRQKAIGAPRFR